MVIFGGCVPDGKTQVTIEYVPQVVDEIIEVVRLIPQESFQRRTVEQVVHVPVPQVVEEIAGVAQIIHQERITKRIIDRIVCVPVVMQRQAPTIQTVQKTVEVPQVQSLIEWQTCCDAATSANVTKAPFKSPEAHDTCARSRGVSENSDSQTALRRLTHDHEARAGALMAHHPASSRLTSTVHSCSRKGGSCGWLTALQTTPKLLQHGSGAAVLVAVEQERSASVSNSVSACGCATSEKQDQVVKHTAKPMRIPPSISAEMLTIAVCTHAGPRGTCVDGVSSHSGEYDPGSGRRTSTEIRCVKTLTIVVFLGCSSNGDIMRLRIRCELSTWKGSCLTSSMVIVVTDCSSSSSPHLQRQGAFSRRDHHI